MTTPAWLCACGRRVRPLWRRITAFVRAHALFCICCVVGVCGGFFGLLVGCATGIFAELIIRRLREEKAAPHSDGVTQPQPPRDPQSATELAAAFATLDLAPTATLDEVKSAHRRLAAQHHPDTATGGNEARFLQIQAAYELICARTDC